MVEPSAFFASVDHAALLICLTMRFLWAWNLRLPFFRRGLYAFKFVRRWHKARRSSMVMERAPG